MAMTIVLYKGCPVNGGSVASNKSNLANQLSYFNTFPSHTFNVNSVRFGDPIRLGKSIKELAGYNFGYINYGDNFYYFINVLDFNFITESQTEIIYKLDAYETVTNQCNLGFAHSYITNYGPYPRGDIHLPKDPYYWIDTESFSSTRAGCFIGMISVESSSGVSVPNAILIPCINLFTFRDVLNGSWLNQLNLDPLPLASDVYFFAYCPFEVISTSGWYPCSKESSPYQIYRSPEYKDQDLVNPFDSISTTSITEVSAIRDMRKNIVWRCPYGHTYTVRVTTLVITATSAKCEIHLREGDDYQIATIPCESVDIYTDSWKEYYYRLRDSDKALRDIGYQQQLVNGITSSLSGGVNGAIAGNLGGSGAMAGAVAGIGLGIAGSVANYGLSKYFDPKLQAQYDRQAIRQSDALNLIGDLTSIMFSINWAGKTSLVPDSASLEAFNTYIENYGYNTELYLSNDDPRTYSGKNVTYIRGSVDVTGDCPNAWLTEIAERFALGVYFV